jgi:predicted DNA-binding transcriptional regulator YafY
MARKPRTRVKSRPRTANGARAETHERAAAAGPAILRQWLILVMLPPPPRRIDSAAIATALRERGYDVHRRTVQRDLVQLSAIFPIVADERRRPFGWRWSESATFPHLSRLAFANDVPSAPPSSPRDLDDSGTVRVPPRARTEPRADDDPPRRLRVRIRVRTAVIVTLVEALRARSDWREQPDGDDGAFRLVDCALDDTPSMVRLLFSFADDLEVIAPDALRRKMAERAARAARRYGR